MRRLAAIAGLVTLLFGVHDATGESALDHWTWRNPLPRGGTLRAVAYGNSQFVAVGDEGMILRSQDGLQWSEQGSGTRNPLSLAAFGGERFVVAGRYGSGMFKGFLQVSEDGRTWERAFTGDTAFVGLAYGSERFVALSASGDSFTSTNGRDWIVNPSGSSPGAYSLAYVSGRFIAESPSGPKVSANGLAWQEHAAFAREPLQVLDFFRSRWVGAGFSGSVYLSSDGESWEEQTLVPSTRLQALAHSESRIVGVGGEGAILTSEDGVEWFLAANLGASQIFSAVAYGSHRFVAVGSSILTSEDAKDWIPRTTNLFGVPITNLYTLSGAVSGQGKLVSVGGAIDGGPAAIVWSTNGRDWTAIRPPLTNLLESVAYGGGRFVAVGDAGYVATSTNGLDWSAGFIEKAPLLVDCVYGQDRFVAIAQRGGIYFSTDGATWTQGDFDTERVRMWQVAYGDGKFVAVGTRESGFQDGVVMVSADGVRWTRVASIPYAMFRDVVFGDGTWVLLGYNNGSTRPWLWWSKDLVNWQEADHESQRLPWATEFEAPSLVNSAPHLALQSGNSTPTPTPATPRLHWSALNPRAAYLHGRFLIAAGNRMYSSVDGHHWEARQVPMSGDILGMAEIADSVVLVGFRAAILQSEPELWTRLAPPEVRERHLQFRIRGSAQRRHRIESAESPTGAAWNPLGEVQVDDSGAARFMTDLSTAARSRFFRTLVTDPVPGSGRE